MSGAGVHPDEEWLPISVRQRASEIEGYGLSITVVLDDLADGLDATDVEELL